MKCTFPCTVHSHKKNPLPLRRICVKGAVMRMKNGTYRLSQAPYGYRLDEKGGFLICRKKRKVVRKIFGDFLSGKSIREIANELAQAQVPKLKGNPVWSATRVSYILTNERYMGDELFQKRFTTDAFPLKSKEPWREKPILCGEYP